MIRVAADRGGAGLGQRRSGEGGRGAGEVERDDGQDQPGGIGRESSEGRWARAEFFRSAWTCSMIAWPRWVLSAVTVSRSVVVKNAWKRQVSNRVALPVCRCGG